MSPSVEHQPDTVSKATQTEDDWAEIRADVKKLVNAVQSLVPQPKPVEIERQFSADPEVWIDKMRPTREKREFFVDVLLATFVGNPAKAYGVLNARIVGAICDRYRYEGDFRFIYSLTLKLSDWWEVSRGRLYIEYVSPLREYLMERCARCHCEGDWETATRWTWRMHTELNGLSAMSKYEPDKRQFFPWGSGWAKTHGEDMRPVVSMLPITGYGTIRLLEHTASHGHFDFATINYIFVIMGRWIHGDKTTLTLFEFANSMMYFLTAHAGRWPSRNVRTSHSSMASYGPVSGPGFLLQWLQIHFRCFEVVSSFKDYERGTGLKCGRERAKIGTYVLEERRISVLGSVSTSNGLDENPPPFFCIVILRDFQAAPEKSQGYNWKPGLEGTIAFQAAVFSSASLWEIKWNDVLDKVDEVLRVRLEDTMDREGIHKWLFDDNFQRSELYVAILQVLRIFGEYIRTASDDVSILDHVFLETKNFPMRDMTPGELEVMQSNWRLVKDFQKRAEEGLLTRIMHKTEEVKSLRDGLFNATSLREANRGSLNNRYILIFTVVTILYLPPSFLSTVFDMDIFKKDIAQTRWEYKVTIVSLSLFTYLLAFISIIAVDWAGFKRKQLPWWKQAVKLLAPIAALWSYLKLIFLDCVKRASDKKASTGSASALP